jgi:hypothetical protein
MIIAQNLNLPGSQVASPADPGNIRIVPFRRERAYKQNSRDWSFYAMKDRIEMRSGDSEISGLFYQSSIPTVEVALASLARLFKRAFREKAIVGTIGASDNRSVNLQCLLEHLHSPQANPTLVEEAKYHALKRYGEVAIANSPLKACNVLAVDVGLFKDAPSFLLNAYELGRHIKVIDCRILH